jgi:hypothetical protein
MRRVEHREVLARSAAQGAKPTSPSDLPQPGSHILRTEIRNRVISLLDVASAAKRLDVADVMRASLAHGKDVVRMRHTPWVELVEFRAASDASVLEPTDKPRELRIRSAGALFVFALLTTKAPDLSW